MAVHGDHDVTIKGRKTIEVTGVSSVESFDVNHFTLTTVAGPLQIEGANLHMKRLDLQAGVAVIEGTVTNFFYITEKARKKRISGRLFR